MTCLNCRSRLPGPAAGCPLVIRLMVASLAVVSTGSALQAQGPADLKWWTDRSTSGGEDDDRGSLQATDGPSRFGAASTEIDRSNLRWWDEKSSLENLKWWNASSAAEDSGWWSEGRTNSAVIAVQDEFAPQPPPAAQQPPARIVPERPMLDEGRTRGAEGIEFDPFGVVPPLRPLRSISASLTSDPATDESVVGGELPFNGTAEEYFAQKGSVFLAPRVWHNRTPEAAAYQFYSRPLWYEDANLERCGHTVGCLQPVVSGTYFFANTALLPYRFAAEPQCSVVPQKGFCPPGCRYSHCDNYLPPWSPAGAISQAAAVTGLVFLIP